MKRYWLLGLIIFLGLGGLWSLSGSQSHLQNVVVGHSPEFAAVKSMEQKTGEQKASGQDPTAPVTGQLEPQEAGDLDSLDQVAQAAVKECTGTAGLESLTEVAHDIAKQLGRSKNRPIVDHANYEFTEPSGRTVILHITASKAAKLFTLDAERLPLKLKLPEDLQNLAPDEMVQKLAAQNKLVKTEISEQESFDGGTIRRLVVNGRVVKIEATNSSLGNLLDCDLGLESKRVECACKK